MGFFFVAETGEISNLDLIQDIDKIVKLVEVLETNILTTLRQFHLNIEIF
jgi:hypothetical protein